jgi:hypothetical protein
MKRCLFCKTPCDSSRSAEHILPESLGNTQHVLPAGVVCDGCNNYFARKVEDPFLNSGAVRALRAAQGVRNKRGRLLGQDAILMGEHSAMLYTPYDAMPVLDVPTAAGINALFNAKNGTIVVPAENAPPSDQVTSRFLAKMALEAMALKGIEAGLDVDYLVDHNQLDLLRAHARRGEPRNWPFSRRRIYEANKPWNDPDGLHQRVHEHDFLVTEHSEYFFVLAIFGLEFAINMGGTEIGGYLQWLEAHGQVSPLYFAKNAHPDYELRTRL